MNTLHRLTPIQSKTAAALLAPLSHIAISNARIRNLLGYKYAVLLALGCTVLPALRAQYTPPPPARPFPGYMNEQLRTDNVYASAWDVGVNIRVRGEHKDDAGFTDAGSNWDFSLRPQDDNNNHYQLLRVMPR